MRRLTSDPAEVFGVKGRGRLAPGLAADVAVFDPTRVGSTNRGERRFDLPGGAKRMVMPSHGVEYIVANGAVTWQDGKRTGATASQVLPREVCRDSPAQRRGIARPDRNLNPPSRNSSLRHTSSFL